MECFDEQKELLCNVMLIKALLPFAPITDQNRIQEWMNRIYEENNGLTDVRARNEYSLYLLINLQKGTLLHPFNKSPPCGKMKPLCRVVPDYLYEDLQKQFKVSYCKLMNMLEANNDSYEMPDLKCKPSNFHSEQPRPRKGIIASFAVFSNYEDN